MQLQITIQIQRTESVNPAQGLTTTPRSARRNDCPGRRQTPTARTFYHLQIIYLKVSNVLEHLAPKKFRQAEALNAIDPPKKKNIKKNSSFRISDHNALWISKEQLFVAFNDSSYLGIATFRMVGRG